MKYFLRIITAIVLMFIIFSCEKQGTRPDENETVNFKVQLASANMPASVFSIQGELTREGFDTLSAVFTMAENYAIADFGNVIAGEWQLSVTAFDEYSTLIYYGETPVNILWSNSSFFLNSETGFANSTPIISPFPRICILLLISASFSMR